MGMYDDLFVAQSLIDVVIKDTGFVLEKYKNYYSFQTKDLDNTLTSFYIDRDGSFIIEKQEYVYKQPDPNKKWALGSLEPVGQPEKIKDNRSAYINFYDFYNTEDERIFITFKAHVRDGRLVDPISIENIERTDLREERKKAEKNLEEWLRTETTWQWQLAGFIGAIRWKISNFFQIFNKGLDCIESNLREQARNQTKLL